MGSEIRCRVKFVVNPKCQRSINKKYYPDDKLVVLKIIANHVSEIPALIEDEGRLLQQNYDWNIEWNWHNAPEEVRKSDDVKNRIYAIFTRLGRPDGANPSTGGDRPAAINIGHSAELTLQFASASQGVSTSQGISALEVSKPKLNPFDFGIYPSDAPAKVAQFDQPKIPQVLQIPQSSVRSGSIEDMQILASQVIMHISTHGKNPPMTGLIKDKQRLKAHNFIMSVTNRNDLTHNQTMEIANTVSKKIYATD